MIALKEYENIISVIDTEIIKISEILKKFFDINGVFLPEAVKKFLLQQSKKIRSVTAILFIKAIYSKVTDKQLKILALTEMIHNASLIHDDVIDEAKIRRNKQSINSIFGNNFAVITGDYILSLALKELLNFNNQKLTNLFINSLYEVCRGEFEQDFHKNEIITIKEYIKKSERKTSELFKTALSGALISENQMEKINIAEDFAKNFGIMFQIRNDLIDFLNGKTGAKNDIDNGIYTAPVIYISEIYNIKNIVKMNDVENAEAAEKTRELLNAYGRKTLDLISSFPDNVYRNALINLCLEVQKNA